MDTAVVLSYMVMVVLFVFLVGVIGLIAYHYVFYRFVLRGRGWLITEYVMVSLVACTDLELVHGMRRRTKPLYTVWWRRSSSKSGTILNPFSGQYSNAFRASAFVSISVRMIPERRNGGARTLRLVCRDLIVWRRPLHCLEIARDLCSRV